MISRRFPSTIAASQLADLERLLTEVTVKRTLTALLAAAGLVLAGQAAAQITLFQDDGFQGRRFSTDHPVDNFANSGFNDEVSSAEVRGGSWQVCTDAYFKGRCVVLRPGSYPSVGALGLNDRISSVRPIDRYGRGDEREYHGDRGRSADRAWDRRYDERYDNRSDDRYYERRGDRDGDWYHGQ